jgi:hypothetical protein
MKDKENKERIEEELVSMLKNVMKDKNESFVSNSCHESFYILDESISYNDKSIIKDTTQQKIKGNLFENKTLNAETKIFSQNNKYFSNNYNQMKIYSSVNILTNEVNSANFFISPHDLAYLNRSVNINNPFDKFHLKNHSSDQPQYYSSNKYINFNLPIYASTNNNLLLKDTYNIKNNQFIDENIKFSTQYQNNFLCNDECKKLEEKLKISGKINNEIYFILKGKFIFIIKAQNLSKLLKKYIKDTPEDILHKIFLEISDNLNFLFMDTYSGNYCVKLFERLGKDDRFIFLNKVRNLIFKFCNLNLFSKFKISLN